MFKICIKCNENKNVDDFYKRSEDKTKYHNICKTCYRNFKTPTNNIYIKTCSKCKKQKSIQQFAIRSYKNKKYYRNNCLDCENEYKRKWEESNPEKQNIYAQNRKNTIEQLKLENPKAYEEMRQKEKERKLNEPIEKVIFYDAKSRAKKKNIEFNIELSDIIIPEYCPILNIKLNNKKERSHSTKNNSPSIDRLNNDFGYIKGNIRIISWKANKIKNESSFEEFEKIYFWWKKEKMAVETGLEPVRLSSVY